MLADKILSTDELSHQSTEELKQKILQLTASRDAEPIKQKVLFYKNELAPIVEELNRRNPYPRAEDQVPLVQGVWSSVWSTIPYQDIVPGRLREQSYQIFHDNGYYANMARYAPGHKIPFLQKLSSILFAYDLMVLQRYEVRESQWQIQNIEIEQSFRFGAMPLSIEKAEEWFTKVVASRKNKSSQTIDSPQVPSLENLDKSTAKTLKTAFLMVPQFEHLYIDHDFRVVKTQREAKQRPSYTIAVRLE
ncbi:hypothetical protein [Allocoleopsis franciscana]|uniref:Plastid lipid-associated protein/fibrillin conserved domain-containing protein n=1 Tax=Allocoleopsis franciscana PCC 7113 TaxID=1173027 RepID=K9WJX1_9CYAN|nr:hypothetical protein Mic7113_4357 [Allocoleopsis franciscana PCC 7113]